MNITPEQQQAIQEALASQDKDAVFEIVNQIFSPQEQIREGIPQEEGVKMNWENYKK